MAANSVLQKFRASNSRQRNFNQKKLERLIKSIDERIASYVKELDEQDKEEPVVKMPSAEEVQEKIKQLNEQRGKYQELERQLKESEEQQISLTDPDSRLMKDKASTEVCYNVQTVVDAQHKLILEHEVVLPQTELEFVSFWHSLSSEGDRYVTESTYILYRDGKARHLA